MVVVLVLLASACAARREDPTTRPEVKRYGIGATAEPGGPAAELGPRGGEGPTARIPAGPDAEAGPADPASPVNDLGRLGTNVRHYLSSEIPRLIVEVDAVKGFEPSPAALDTLRTRLREISDKPRGIEILPVSAVVAPRTRWTRADLLGAQQRHRDRWSTADEAVVYVLYVNGVFADDAYALGVSFTSSMLSIFADQIRNSAATPLVSGRAIETAVVVHEMGHVLALVDIGYRSPRPREDPQHPGHSSNPDSVMYWAVDNVGVASLLGGRTTPPTTFDADDRADLADLRSGRLRVE